MQTNRNKNHRLSLILLPLSVLLVSVLLAPVLTGAENEHPEQVKVEAEPDEQAPENAESDAVGKLEEADQAEARPVKEFKPSEQIGADSAVSFPIDI